MSFAHLFYILRLKNAGLLSYSSEDFPLVVIELRERGLVNTGSWNVTLSEKGEAEANEAIQNFQKRNA